MAVPLLCFTLTAVAATTPAFPHGDQYGFILHYLTSEVTRPCSCSQYMLVIEWITFIASARRAFLICSLGIDSVLNKKAQTKQNTSICRVYIQLGYAVCFRLLVIS